MRYFKMTLAYDGSNYHGWQRQSNALAVQEVVEDAIFKLTGENVVVQGCSRTDAGVHAREYVLSFGLELPINCRGIQLGLNSWLPDDISVIGCEEADEGFHARYMCKGKEYEYIVHNSRIKDPFMRNTAFRNTYPIDEVLLDRAAKDFVGEHDFKAFCSTACDKEITVRKIYRFDVRREGDKVIFTVAGNGFLYNMVRIMVGTLLFINEGKIAADAIPRILDSKDRKKAGKTVPPQGLYLNKVYYDEVSVD
ncbi:tRNA pseudouridine(38-40) synthase TruA [Ruminococcus sp.]|uniref:tRNA pseudouridine(38-40) synthase TruA n=1 Tax=Ruminococcus sp. TaxID=41978 RepID=UPI00258D87B4|nr:tRNA pseudouridine(38-40) synthase TruA [Ruminococcus sp.]MCR5019423.1 tRNA pseudouridine(38-40) synthase TruA [Ruminococcus sp.]